MRNRGWGWALVVIPPVLFLGYFFVYPVARILVLGLGELDAAGGSSVLARLRSVGWFTVWQAAVSTVLTFLVAAPMTWAVSTFEFPGRKVATALVTVPFVLPTVVVGTAFIALGMSDSILAILAAHVFFNVAVVVRTVSTLWSRIDPSIPEAARVLGASRSQVLRLIVLPLLRPAIASAASIVFLFTFTSFGIILILGGFGLATLEVEVYRQAIVLFDLPLASALAVAQLIGVGLALLAYSRYQERTASSWVMERAARRPPRPGGERAAVAASVIGTLALLSIPVLVLVARSADPANYARLATDTGVAGAPIEAVGNSLGYAATATLIAALIGIMSAAVITRGPGRPAAWFDWTLMLPLGTSAVTIGLGFVVALGWPLDLRGSRWLVPVAHALVAVPFVVRSTVPTLRAISEDVRDAAAVLGASPFRVWREIDLPIVSRAALVGAGFAFVVSLGEFGATSLVARPTAPTITTMIFRLLARPGGQTLGMAMALSVLLAAVTAAVVLAIDRSRFGQIGRF